MRGSELVHGFLALLVWLAISAWISRCFFGSLKPLPLVSVAFLFISYKAAQIMPGVVLPSIVAVPVSDQGHEMPQLVKALAGPGDDIARVMEALENIEVLLQRYGAWIEGTGIACLEAFRTTHEEHQNLLRQYTDFKQEHSEQLGLVVNVLDGHRNDITEASRASAANNVSLCNIIGQYKKGIQDCLNSLKDHIASTNIIREGQDTAIKCTNELVVQRTDALQTKLDGHGRVIEENKKLVKDHGASIDIVVSDHAELVAEFQLIFDGMVSMKTANQVFSLIQEPLGWETLGDIAELVDEGSSIAGHMGTWSGTEPASLVDNVQKLSRMFRGPTTKMAQVAKPGLMDQIMAAMSSTIQTTVQSAVDAQHAEEMKQLRKVQKEMEGLRAELEEIQEFRRLLRKKEGLEQQIEELKDRNKRRDEIMEIFKNDPKRLKKDKKFRKQAEKMLREFEEEEKRETADIASSSPGKKASSA